MTKNWKVYKDDIGFEEALNLMKCKGCGKPIIWDTSEFDTDGSILYTNCACGLKYSMKALTVQIEVSDK